MTALAICAFVMVADIPPDYCYELSELPILASWYWPPLGGINCDHDCNVMADNLPWDESDANQVAACPMSMHYATVVTSLGSWHCRDTGGGIIVRNHPHFGPVIHVDVLRPEAWAWGDLVLIENWRLR